MGSVSVTHLIMFIGSLVVAAAVAGTIVAEVGQVSDTIEVRGSGTVDEIETEIVIISDEAVSEAIVEDGVGEQTVTILIKNVGDNDLSATPATIDVLVEGSFITNDDMEVERVENEDRTDWPPGSVVEVTITLEDESISDDTTVTAIVNGNEDRIRFHV